MYTSTLEIIKMLHDENQSDKPLREFIQKMQKALRQQCFESPPAK